MAIRNSRGRILCPKGPIMSGEYEREIAKDLAYVKANKNLLIPSELESFEILEDQFKTCFRKKSNYDRGCDIKKLNGIVANIEARIADPETTKFLLSLMK